MSCAVCSSTLTGRQRAYCSRKCKARASQVRRNTGGRNALRDRVRYVKERTRRLAWQQRYYVENREERTAYSARWRAANPERRRLSNQKRRALARNNPGYVPVTLAEWRSILRRARKTCTYCGIDGPLTADHVVPLCRGGRHAPANLVAACASCNSKKQGRFLAEWKLELRKRGDPYPFQARIRR